MTSNDSPNLPLYSRADAASVLTMDPLTLAVYEKSGLIVPVRHNRRVYYTQKHLHQVECIKYLINDVGMSVSTLKSVLKNQKINLEDFCTKVLLSRSLLWADAPQNHTSRPGLRLASKVRNIFSC